MVYFLHVHSVLSDILLFEVKLAKMFVVCSFTIIMFRSVVSRLQTPVMASEVVPGHVCAQNWILIKEHSGFM